MENWYIINKKNNYNKIKNNKNFTSIQKLILANRDINDDYKLSTFINPIFENLHDPFLMKDMDKAVNILMEYIRKNKNILIVGDYDQDGVSATVILYKGIKRFYDKLDYAIPDRIEDGYGLNKSIVDMAKKYGFELIITCDNGIAAFEAIEYANELNIEVLVTDHHEVVKVDGKDKLPNARAVLNPHRSDDNYPFDIICGAMVAFKFIHAIYLTYGKTLSLDMNFIYYLSQFAALGTISDMMPIIDENRIIVIIGLKELNKKNNHGLKILLEELSWESDVTIYTVGFLIGPTINSSGRIYTAKLGVELFLENDIDILRQYAKTLVELNNDRKNMTKESVDLAIKHIEYEKLYKNDIIILYENKIHESICGLVAGRIKDKYNRPTIVLTDSSEDGVIKGSGRSIKSYNMFENLDKFRKYFISFGGHAMACGLSLNKEDLNKLSNEINDESKLTKEDFYKELNIDFALKFEQINSKLIEDIDFLRPFGFEFQEPLFATKNVKVISSKLIGKNNNVLKLILDDYSSRISAIAFNLENLIESLKTRNIENSEQLIKLEGDSVDIVYKVSVNTFRGVSNIQLNIVSMR